MARNAPDPSSRRQSSRVTKAPVQREPQPTRYQQKRNRRQFWVQIVAAFLVLAMLLPIVISFL